MKKRKILIVLLYMWSGYSNASAQELSSVILQKSLHKINSLKNIRYTENFTQVNPFSKGDTSTGIIVNISEFSTDSRLKRMDERTYNAQRHEESRRIFKNNNMYSLSFSNSIYSIDKKVDDNTLSSDFIAVKQIIEKNIFKAIRLNDTSIHKNFCFQFFIKAYDVIENGMHNYTYYTVALNKKSLLPVYFKEVGEGVATKAGYVIGRLKFLTKQNYDHYKVNGRLNDDVFDFDSAKFTPQNEQMLHIGDSAPSFNVSDLGGKKISRQVFADKIILVEFSATDCPANALTHAVMNRLYIRYKGKNVFVFSVYSDKSKEMVKRYSDTNSLAFPIYLGTNLLSKDFKIVGVPNFYIIDIKNKIAYCLNGYNSGIEETLSAKIDSLLIKGK